MGVGWGGGITSPLMAAMGLGLGSSGLSLGLGSSDLSLDSSNDTTGIHQIYHGVYLNPSNEIRLTPINESPVMEKGVNQSSTSA